MRCQRGTGCRACWRILRPSNTGPCGRSCWTIGAHRRFGVANRTNDMRNWNRFERRRRASSWGRCSRGGPRRNRTSCAISGRRNGRSRRPCWGAVPRRTGSANWTNANRVRSWICPRGTRARACRGRWYYCDWGNCCGRSDGRRTNCCWRAAASRRR